MAKITGGQAVVESLQAEGVSHVFGLIGSAGMEIFDALYDAESIRFIGVRDERTGVHMADGYARASGRAGVFLAGQNGPGATNLVTGLAQANAAYSPVVALAGSLSSAHIYRDAFQEVDQQSLFKPVTKKTWTLTQTGRIPEMMREAFRTAMSPRRGPVLLNLPRDLLADTAVCAPERVHRESRSTGLARSRWSPTGSKVRSPCWRSKGSRSRSSGRLRSETSPVLRTSPSHRTVGVPWSAGTATTASAFWQSRDEPSSSNRANCLQGCDPTVSMCLRTGSGRLLPTLVRAKATPTPSASSTCRCSRQGS